MICDCIGPGFCERYQRTMSPRMRQICRSEVLTPEACEVYRQNWAAMANQGKRGEACIHRSDELRTVDCPTCAGRLRVKVFDCALHGECTLAKPLPGIASCQGCRDYEPLPPRAPGPGD